jgi:hypothetical protein
MWGSTLRLFLHFDELASKQLCGALAISAILSTYLGLTQSSNLYNTKITVMAFLDITHVTVS